MSIKSFYILKIFLCLLVFELTNAKGLNVKKTIPPKNKKEFSRLFDKAVINTASELVADVLESKIHVWSFMLAKLPPKDPLLEPIRLQQSTELSYLNYLSKNHSVDEVVDKLKSMNLTEEPDLSGVSDKDKKRFDKLYDKYVMNYFLNEVANAYRVCAASIIREWSKLFGTLKKLDHIIYPQYRVLNENYAQLEKHIASGDEDIFDTIAYGEEIMKEAVDFLDLKYLRKLYNKELKKKKKVKKNA